MDAQLRNYDRRLERTHQKARDNLSKENFSLLEKYDNEMATLGLMKSTRAKPIDQILDKKSIEKAVISQLDKLQIDLKMI
jgi:hypothetical protein